MSDLEKEETKQKFGIDKLIKYLTMFMIIFVSIIVVISIFRGIYDTTGIAVGISFIFFLIFLKWIIKESGIE